MAFNSLDYTIFLCIAFVGFWQLLKRPHLRLLFLLLASYFFYTAWNGVLVLLILLSTSIDFVAGLLIDRYRQHKGLKRAFFLVSVIANLSILGFFKYVNFFIDNANALVELLGYDPTLARLDILLPIGISFYTFQSLSYTLDIYLDKIKPAASWRHFFLFVAFFPQLVAGPIVRAREFLPQLERQPRLSRDDLAHGVYLLLRGMVKKMVIADYLAHSIVDPVFATQSLFTSAEIFVALVAFHYQVYCDFSGYTDIALGSARLFGFSLPDNFDTPYLAHTPNNFWRRWHMTLSRFAFDYLYIPLGGSKGREIRAQINIFITFAVIGFWHGANWTYVLFGIWHALSVMLTRIIMRVAGWWTGRHHRSIEDGLAGNPVAILATNLVIILALPLFRSPDVPTALQIYHHLFSLSGVSIGFGSTSLAFVLFAMVAHYIPSSWEQRIITTYGQLAPVFQGAVVVIVAYGVQSMAVLAKRSFVYFQF